MIPLFSFFSKRSAGVGEFPDLVTLADWAKACGLSLIQLLPLNDVGGRFCPYDAESSFALEPMHICLEDVEGVPSKPYSRRIAALRSSIAADPYWLDPKVKDGKLRILRDMFTAGGDKKSRALEDFKRKNRYWLPDYALYRALKREHGQRSWEDWPAPLKDRDRAALVAARMSHQDEIAFQTWLQWQASRQLKRASGVLRKKGVHLVGDLPFLVSRDSADVWAHRDHFKLGLSSGAPPDMYFEDGQEWGMPPYDWDRLAATGYEYLREKLSYAGGFYDLYRIDHFVGLLRVWVFPRDGHDKKKRAYFDPPGETAWEGQARGILDAMTQGTDMLPCAEDLGTVPDLARELLEEYGIPGMEVQRWTRDWKGSGEFLTPDRYRAIAISTLSTHDMGPFLQWWREEATEEDKVRFARFTSLSAAGEPEWLAAALKLACESASIFSIHSFQDWLSLTGVFRGESRFWRVNRPGIVHEMNWRLRAPEAVETWMNPASVRVVREIVRACGRLC